MGLEGLNYFVLCYDSNIFWRQDESFLQIVFIPYIHFYVNRSTLIYTSTYNTC